MQGQFQDSPAAHEYLTGAGNPPCPSLHQTAPLLHPAVMTRQQPCPSILAYPGRNKRGSPAPPVALREASMNSLATMPTDTAILLASLIVTLLIWARVAGDLLLLAPI